MLRPPSSTHFPYTTLFRSYPRLEAGAFGGKVIIGALQDVVKNLPDAKAKPDETFKNTGRFFLTRTDDGILALYRKCRSEEHTSELQSHSDLVCRLLLEKKN